VAAVTDLGLYDEEYDIRQAVQSYVSGLLIFELALCLAIELNEVHVAQRVKGTLELIAQPRYFDDGSFGFFYHFGEAWPRGQLCALLMVAEVLEAGAWQRAFNNPSYEARFTAPSIEGVDYPALGLSQAWNDATEGMLHISTYAATLSQAGQNTTFRVVNLPSTAKLQIYCNGARFNDWKKLNATAIEMYITIEHHMFTLNTGYTGPTGTGVGARDSRL